MLIINKKTFYDFQVGGQFKVKKYECEDIPYTYFIATYFKGAEFIMIHYFEHNNKLLQNKNTLSVTIFTPKMDIDIDADIKTEEDAYAIKRLISEVLD